MDHFDSIIIGAGHNGLVCAAYLAKAGQQVLVLEAADSTGGLAANREFHAGFRSSVTHSVNHFPDKIIKDLALEAHGLRVFTGPSVMIGLGPDGNHVVLDGGSISGVGANDVDSYGRFNRLMGRFADSLKPFWLKTIPRAAINRGISSPNDLLTFGRIGLKLRLLGRKNMREFMRIATLPARDLMDEYFDNEILKSMLCWDGLIGSKIAPRSPNHAILPMLYRMSGKHCGEPGRLVNALQSAVIKNGAEIRTGTKVKRILVEPKNSELATQGVQLDNGEQINASRIISAADPQTTFLKLVGVENLEIEFSNRIRRLRCEGYVAKLQLALSDLPKFTGLDEVRGRLLIAPDMDSIEFAFDEAKYGQSSTRPVMEIVIPSLQDTSLAPEGQHVLSAHIMYAPYQLKGGWDDSARESLLQHCIDTIAQYAPGIREQIIHAEMLTPQDLEQHFNVKGGHWHHTEFALDQALMMRPTYQAAQYRTPLPGLYLCGAGCHPGGDLTGGPGHNAAHEILRKAN